MLETFDGLTAALTMAARQVVLAALLASSVGATARAQGARPGAPTAPRPALATYDVRAYGARGDSVSLDTDAINRAIDSAAAAGGGTVYFGPGIYSSFSIHLRSNVALYLDRGATLLAANPAERSDGGYDASEPASSKYQDYGHSHFHNSLIWGEHIHDVAILGPGRIDGSGMIRNMNADTPRVGNKTIALRSVRGVLLRDFSILKGAHFGVLATGVDGLTIDNLTIDTNRDGIDIDACRNVRITNTSVNSPFDDAIVLKTSEALGERRATEDVTIANDFVSGFAVGSVLDGSYRPFTEGDPNRDGPTGRVKLGTESAGDFRNITISNVVFDNSRGLALETVDGSALEDVTISNITMRHVWTSPLFLRLGARMRAAPGAAVGALRRVLISNIVASDVDPRYASSITGLPGHPVEDVRLTNIRIQYRGGVAVDQVRNQPKQLAHGKDPLIPGPREPYMVPELPKAYPEPSMFGLLPAYGFYLKHVAGLVMDGVEVTVGPEDERPAFVLDDVRDAEFSRVRAQKNGATPTFVLRGVDDFRALQSRPVADTVVKHTAEARF